MPILADLYYFAFEGGEKESPPVILIHGAGGNYLSWPPELRRLPGYRIYTLDLPGHHKSDGCGQQSIAAYTDSLLEWLAAMNLHRAVFVGHSMGSAIALNLAFQHPAHVAGLVLIGAAPQFQVSQELLIDLASPATFQKGVQALVQASFSSSANVRLVEQIEQQLNQIRPSVLYGDLLACTAFGVDGMAANIQFPTLVLCGAEDRLTPPRFSQFLAGAIPNARLEIIPHAGHMVMLEQPQATAAALKAFLQSVPYRPG